MRPSKARSRDPRPETKGFGNRRIILFELEHTMSADRGIPVLHEPINMLALGPNGNSLRSSAARKHPIDELQLRESSSPFADLEFVQQVYGSGLAMRLATEQKIAVEHKMDARAPGLQSSNLYGEIVSNTDTTLAFSDYLSVPKNRAGAHDQNPHVAFDRLLQ